MSKKWLDLLFKEIRKAITTGNVRLASELMGDNFSISGKVIHGNQIGKELGYQTANLALADYVRPKHGVYAVIVKLAGVKYKAIANFGLRPTITTNSKQFWKSIYLTLIKRFMMQNIR